MMAYKSRKLLYYSIRIYSNNSSGFSPLRGFCLEQNRRKLISALHPPSLADSDFTPLTKFPNVIYAGFDPTSDSLHVGNLLILTSLLRASLFGCQAIALVGSATARIGDPSGRTNDRAEIARETITNFTSSIRNQLERINKNFQQMYGCNGLEILDNHDWFSKLSLFDFVQICRDFRLGEMLRMGAIKARIRDRNGLRCSEFLYQIFQSYDWRVINETKNCFFQIGGSDQLGHIDGGSDYIKKLFGKLVGGFCLPLVLDAHGRKLGKSSDDGTSNIWLSEKKTSPFSFYQYFRQKSDAEILPLLWWFSLRSSSEIEALSAQHTADLGKWIAQDALACELTELVFGKEKLETAQRCSKALFYGNFEHLFEESKENVVTQFGEASVFRLDPSRFANFGELADVTRKGQPKGSFLMTKGAFKLNGQKYLDPQELFNFDAVNFCGKDITVVCWGKRNFSLISWETHISEL